MVAAPLLARAQTDRLDTLPGLHTDKPAPVLPAQVAHLPGLLLPGVPHHRVRQVGLLEQDLPTCR